MTSTLHLKTGMTKVGSKIQQPCIARYKQGNHLVRVNVLECYYYTGGTVRNLIRFLDGTEKEVDNSMLKF